MFNIIYPPRNPNRDALQPERSALNYFKYLLDLQYISQLKLGIISTEVCTLVKSSYLHFDSNPSRNLLHISYHILLNAFQYTAYNT